MQHISILSLANLIIEGYTTCSQVLKRAVTLTASLIGQLIRSALWNKLVMDWRERRNVGIWIN